MYLIVSLCLVVVHHRIDAAVEDRSPLIEFIDYTLWVCGSSLTVGVVEDNATINSNSPGLLTPPAAISLPDPDRTHRPCPECPEQLHHSPPQRSSTDQNHEPAPDSYQKPLPITEPEPAIEFILESEPVTTSVLRQDLIARSITESASSGQSKALDSPCSSGASQLLGSAFAADSVQLFGPPQAPSPPA